jgi:hypothetical protein
MLCTLACGGPSDVPSTPDLSQLVVDYQNPTAELDAARAREALAELPDLERLAAAFRAGRFAADDVGPATEQNQPANGLRVQGSIRLTARCPGELSEPVLDPAVNGTVSLTLAVADSRIKRGIGGLAEGCVLRETVLGETVRVELDGPIAFDLGSDIGLGSPLSGNLLVQFEGVNVAGQEFAKVSARFTDGRVEHLFTRNDGRTIVAAVGPSGVTIRDGRGLWLCLDTQTCVSQ